MSPSERNVELFAPKPAHQTTALHCCSGSFPGIQAGFAFHVQLRWALQKHKYVCSWRWKHGAACGVSSPLLT